MVSSQTNASGWPAADFAKVQLLADQKELGVVFDTWILNPIDANDFNIVYGENANQVLANHGIRFITSNRITAGTAYVIESGNVGQMRLEKPLSTETWREQGTQRTWVQSRCPAGVRHHQSLLDREGDTAMTKRTILTGVGTYVGKRGDEPVPARGDSRVTRSTCTRTSWRSSTRSTSRTAPARRSPTSVWVSTCSARWRLPRRRSDEEEEEEEPPVDGQEGAGQEGT